LEEALYPLLGACVAVIATMSGVGGGVFFVPLLALALGYPVPLAVGTSKAVVAVVTSFGGIAYMRRGMASAREVAPIVAAMLPSSAAGAWLVAYVDPRLIEVVVGSFVAFYGARLVYRSLRPPSSPAGGERRGGRGAAVKLAAGAVAGLIAGLTGTGGGAVLVPILTGVLGMRLKEAVAASTLAIFPGSVAAAAVHAATGTVDARLWALLAPGAAAGALLGPRIVASIRVSWLRPLVGSVLLLVGLRMLAG
jgi:uncharacterized membrane protein YfcA